MEGNIFNQENTTMPLISFYVGVEILSLKALNAWSPVVCFDDNTLNSITIQYYLN